MRAHIGIDAFRDRAALPMLLFRLGGLHPRAPSSFRTITPC
jgi:hypothetical protein